MSAERVAVRYAKAFVAVLQERNALAEARTFLEFCGIVANHPELARLLSNASLSAGQKGAVVAALSDRLGHSELLRKFLHVLGQARRLDVLTAVGQAVALKLDELDNVRNVNLTTAVALSQAELDDFCKNMKHKLGSDVRVTSHVDASILGGAVARVGSVVYDGSVRAQLNRLRAELVKEN